MHGPHSSDLPRGNPVSEDGSVNNYNKEQQISVLIVVVVGTRIPQHGVGYKLYVSVCRRAHKNKQNHTIIITQGRPLPLTTMTISAHFVWIVVVGGNSNSEK